MTEKFINLKDKEVTVSDFVNLPTLVCDLKYLLEAIEECSDETLVCSIESALDYMQHDEWVSSIKADQDTIQNLFNIINESA